MNRVVLLLCAAGFVFLLVSTPLAIPTKAQQPSEAVPSTQRSFSMEDEKFAHPAALPNCVSQLLATDSHVADTLAYAHLTPEQLPADWFAASQIGPDQSNGRLLVVMGTGMMIGANITPLLDLSMVCEILRAAAVCRSS